MSKISPDLYVRVPVVLLRAGLALPVTLYKYLPLSRRVEVYKNRGEMLDLETLQSIRSSIGHEICILKSQLKDAIDSVERESIA
jgi:hypothetical protein